jgi:perosamine synthetase
VSDVSNALPALRGGPPVRPQGPPPWPPADPEVLEALAAAFRDGTWGTYHGPHVARLEEALREYHGIGHVLTCASGTYAVELALRALQIGPGDEVILAAYDYPGNFLNVHAVGAQPVLIDVAPANWNLEVSRLPEAIEPNTRAIIVSHLHGGLAPMREVTHLAHQRGLAVIEDAAQMPGAMIQGKKAGTWGDVGILSFGGSKLLSAGRGGALLTARADVYQRAKTANLRGNLVSPLSELQAAVLLPQLHKLDARNTQRAQAVQQLTELLRGVSGLQAFRNSLPESRPGYYKLGFHFDAAAFGLERARLVSALRAEGIAIDEGFHALHVGRSLRRFRQAGDLAEATRAHEGVVVLHHPVLLGSPSDVAEIATAFEKIRQNADRLRE